MILLNITIYTTMEIMELVFTTCTYNHHTVTVGQYQGTLMLCILSTLHARYTKAIKFIFSYVWIHENTCIYQYHDIEVKMISRSSITITINIVILCSSNYNMYKPQKLIGQMKDKVVTVQGINNIVSAR